MKLTKVLFFLILFIVFFSFSPMVYAASDGEDSTNAITNFSEYNWWPEQPLPEGIVLGKFGASHGQNALLHSVAGLVGKAHKNGDIDELVWIDASGIYRDWYADVLQRTGAEERAELGPWDLVDRYKDEGIIDGYIIYETEYSSNFSDDMDLSYTIAASYAGVENAIIITEDMESEAQSRGFTKILDARDVSREAYFDSLKAHKNRNLVVTMPPSSHNNIDFAIANNAMVSYGTDQVTQEIMEWVNPVHPVVGWNDGDEHTHTSMATRNGLFNTASDWCHNLIVLSAGAKTAEIDKIHSVNPDTLNYDKQGHFHSFIMSDGDNMQWTIGSFVDNEDYWGSPLHGDFPMGFSSPPVNLSLMAPDVLNEISRTQPQNTTVIEYGGGYQYPDLYAEKLSNREEVRREYARTVNANMQRSGATVFGFISDDVNSQEAIDAYKIYAEEIENLTGMIAVDYAPYHGGGGNVMWVENSNGVEIPVVTAKYSLWYNLGGSRAGGPEQVASAINGDVENSDSPQMEWTAVHAWSEFENPSDATESATGVEPVKWTIDRLNDNINVVSPEELLWRIRHKRQETTSVPEEDNVPETFDLQGNYPNPFNPSTEIRFTLANSSKVNLEVFNVKGQRVAHLIDENMSSGKHQISFDASTLPSGIYMYRLQAGEKSEVKKMMLIK